MKKGMIWLASLAYFGLLCACSGGGSVVNPTPTPTPAPTAVPTLAPTPEPTPAPTPTPSPTPIPTPTPSPTPTPTPTPVTGSFTVSGSLSLTPNIYADTDNNDPYSDYADNSLVESAQNLPNFSVVQGFVTELGTGVSGDRYESDPDADDLFHVYLQAGQQLRLQVVDYDGFGVDSSFEGDIDLQLFDSSLDLVDTSQSITEFEELSVPADGEYYIRVYAYSGSSKYVLQIADVFSGSAAPERPVVDFITGEAVVFYHTHSTQNQKPANRLPQLVNLGSATGLHKGSQKSPFESELQSLNRTSYGKVETLEKIKQLQAQDNVLSASANYIRYPQWVPNDEYYPLQWHYPAINLPAAWNITRGVSAGVSDIIVAVVDTGVFLQHVELSGQLVAGYDFISSSFNALDGDGIDADPDDPGDSQIAGQSSWHGTHVAGTVAMLSDNNLGAAGVAPGAKIMPLRALGAQGGTSYDIIQAVSFAAGLSNDSGTLPSQPADVINLSLGGPGFSQAESDFYQSLYDSGVIVVAAAGNENTSSFSYPASYPGVFSVGATDLLGNRAPYSNYGSRVDLAAPGGDTSVDRNSDGYPDGVLSALVDDSSGARTSTLQLYQGTSMASPHVAGVFALMKAVHPSLTAAEINALLVSGELTNDIGDAGRDDLFGYGMIDALKAVNAAQAIANGGSAPESDPIIVANPVQLAFAQSTAANLEITNVGGGSPSLTSVLSSESWLSVAVATVDAAGLGAYTVSINRAGLVPGSYLATLTFNFDTAASVPVTVSMRVGENEHTASVAQLYAILMDVTTLESTHTVFVEQSDNQLSYQIAEVPAGSYYIAVGTDIDNDQIICQTGEGCGAYPTVNRMDPVVVDQNRANMDFTVELMSGLDSLGAAVHVNSDGSAAPSAAVSAPQNGLKRAAF